MSDNELRERLQVFRQELGTPIITIANNIKVSSRTVWRFAEGRSIRKQTLEHLNMYLTRYGF